VSSSPKRLARFTAALCAFAALVTCAAAWRHPMPSAGAVTVLGLLAIFSAGRQVRLSEAVNLSPGFMVCMAGVVVFDGERAILGAVVVGCLSNVRLDQLRARRWSLSLLNIATAGVAFLAAALTYSALPTELTRALPLALAGILLASAAYVVVAWALLVLSYAAEGTRHWRDVLVDLLPAGAEVLPFAVLGFLLGRLYLALGPAILVLIIVPILIAREMFASYMRVKESHEETVHMLIRALEQKDRYTAGHAERVAEYARYIGESLNFMPSRMERLRFAALMHDIGKLVVPNQLLNKPGRLTADEFELVRVHEKVSVQMLDHIDFLRPIAGAGHSENTRFDPDDADHPIEPYIVMIADAYDAMTSTRAYRKALTQEVAFGELRDKAGIQFHPACVEALISAIEARGEKHGAGHEQSDEFEDAPDVGVGSAGLGDLMPSEIV
jgi:HD superfamily phosphodiesterase